jgi:Family of unknown function (DUF5764)
MDLLNESERRFTKKLCDAMIPVMIEAFWEIWLEAKKESQGKNTTRVFQELLRGVKTWNSSISLKNTEAIIKNQSLFPNLLAAVFVIHVKILSAIRTDKKSKKISIKLPANDVFVQRCYEACAKDLYENPSIIVDNKSEEERNNNLNERFHKRICVVIEDLVPTAEILNTYLPLPAAGEDLDMDHEDEDPDEDVPDLADDVPPEEDQTGDVSTLPQNTGNMEFGKTPGGVDTAVTVNNSLTPPSVPGATPAPTEDEGESLFPDAPTKIQKLNHT